MSVFEEFGWRGMVHTASEDAARALASETLTAYIGFDPTAASLHVGSLLPAMALARLQRFGHHPIAIAGGGTGLIGDPSGKTQERQLLTKERAAENLVGIRGQLERFLDFDTKTNPARILNNADWLNSIGLMDFLRDIGKHFTVNSMLARESVRRRVEQEDGISFTEFSYMLLQAYDYLVLYDRFNCRLQMGGSDQWGNIVAGTDLIRRLRAERAATSEARTEKSRPLAHGLVFPLVVTASGVKFGKTEAGAVWLDPRLTSPYRFYQFWIQTDDRDVVRYLKYFTWLTRPEIEALDAACAAAPQQREAQRALAREVTLLVHGESALARAERASRVLFGDSMKDLSLEEIEDVFADVPSGPLSRAQVEAPGTPLADLLVAAGLSISKGEARRAIQSGGIYLNNERRTDERGVVTANDLLAGRLLVLRKGRRDYHLLRLTA
jgi:tyrosyl-tRNA synthetase